MQLDRQVFPSVRLLFLAHHGWLGSVVVMALDLRVDGCPFDSWPRRCRVITLGKLFTLTHTCLCHQAV